jgi:hypothetical protein
MEKKPFLILTEEQALFLICFSHQIALLIVFTIVELLRLNCGLSIALL